MEMSLGTQISIKDMKSLKNPAGNIAGVTAINWNPSDTGLSYRTEFLIKSCSPSQVCTVVSYLVLSVVVANYSYPFPPF